MQGRQTEIIKAHLADAESKQDKEFHYISVNIDTHNLNDAFVSILKKEFMTGDNKWMYEGSLIDAYKFNVYKHLPKVLIFQLIRFS